MVATVNVNVRTGAGIDYPIVAVAMKGASLKLTGRTTDGYAEVTYAGAARWVYAGYLAENASTLPPIIATGITSAQLTLRSEPSPNAASSGLLPAKSVVNLTGAVSGRYRQIVLDSAVRWILSAYVTAAPIGPVATGKPPAPVVVTLSGVNNFRDAAGDIATLKRGVLWRSAKLADATSADEGKLASLLAGGLIIDLRTSGAVSGAPDPTLPGVTRLEFPIASKADYPRYVTEAARRASIAQAITAVANAKGAVLIHCTAGKDRTGWTVAMIQFALGATEAEVRAEYLKSPNVDIADLEAGLAEARRLYGSIDNYLTTGLGLKAETLALLKARLTA